MEHILNPDAWFYFMSTGVAAVCGTEALHYSWVQPVPSHALLTQQLCLPECSGSALTLW